MNVTGIKTKKIRADETTVSRILDTYIPALPQRSVVVITSKIVSLCEGRVITTDGHSKTELAAKEADLYLPPSESKYDITLTIKNNLLIPSAGIDESNGEGKYIFWPEHPQKSANNAREYLVQKYKHDNIGVIISDSKTIPLRWGTIGASIAHSGFSALNDFIGKPDVFGRLLTMTKVNVADALASAAVLVMGESNEQMPLAVITDIPFVEFQDRNPSAEELKNLYIALEDDVYAPILTGVDWKKKDVSPK